MGQAGKGEFHGGDGGEGIGFVHVAHVVDADDFVFERALAAGDDDAHIVAHFLLEGGDIDGVRKGDGGQ